MRFPFIDNPVEFLPLIIPPKKTTWNSSSHTDARSHSLFVKASLSLPSSNSQLATMEIDCARERLCVRARACVCCWWGGSLLPL